MSLVLPRGRYTSLCLLGGVLLLSCGEIAGTRSAEPLRNNDCGRCTPDSACESGRCVQRDTILQTDYLLSVAVPASNVHAPGLNFLFHSRDIAAFLKTSAAKQFGGDPCFILPNPVEVRGRYVANRSLLEGLGVDVSKVQGSVAAAAVPVRTLVFPVFAEIPGRLPRADAASLGLPLDPQWAESTVETDSRIPGVVSDLSPGFRAVVTPGRRVLPEAPDEDGLDFLQYDIVANPSRPLETVLPPRAEAQSAPVDRLKIPSVDALVAPLAQFDATPLLPVTIRTDLATLYGMSARIVDLRRNVTISNVVPLTGPTQSVAFRVVDRALEVKDQYKALFIDPPPLSGMPTYVAEFISPYTPGSPHEYPLVAASVQVTGRLITNEAPNVRRGVAGEVLFRSNLIERIKPDGTTEVGKTELRYETRVETTETGEFSTFLPKGKYQTIVTPKNVDANRDLAKSESLPSETIDLTNLNLADPSSAVPRLRRVPFKTRVSGSVTSSDGHAIAGAQVTFLASPRGTGHPDDSTPYSSPDGFVTVRVPSRRTEDLPRSDHVTADTEGRFAIALDPGEYEVRVEPVLGTGLPSVVKPLTVARYVDESPIPFAVKVPFPRVESIVFRDNKGNPVQGAVLTAYMLRSAPYKNQERDIIRYFVEVGRAKTSNEGRAEILFAPDASNESL